MVTRWKMERITLGDEDVIKKRYKIRRTGKEDSSLETCIPREAFERQARRQGLNIEEVLEKLDAVWIFNNFRGLHLSFEPRETSKWARVNQCLARLRM
ncbi:MAG: hypothetical protein ACETVN_05045 [Asgard group archaeon]